MIYYLLDEPFSAYTGLAISRIIADVMRFDEKSVVVCPRADDTWGFGKERVMVLPQLRILAATVGGSKMRGWRFVPLSTRKDFIRCIFSSFLSKLESRDIVWCYNWPYVAEALESSIHRKGAKLIYHAQNSLAPYATRSLFKSFTPDAFIFNSEAMRKEALGFFPHLKSTYAVHNGADESLFYPPAVDIRRRRSSPVLLYVGRLIPQKGVHVLMEAMRILAERNVQATCRVVGSSHAGGRTGKVTSYIKMLHKRSPGNVHFEGFRTAKAIAQEYRESDIFCCPSIWPEPFGMVNIEAMATGLPVVASRVGGIPEIAAGGGVLLVEPNSAADLAAALQKLIEDNDLRAKMGEEGLASFRRRFSSTKIVKRYYEIVESLEATKSTASIS